MRESLAPPLLLAAASTMAQAGFAMPQTAPPGAGASFAPPPGPQAAPPPIADETPVCIRHPRTHAMLCHTIAEWRQLGVTRADLAQLLRQTREGGLKSPTR